MAANGTKDLPAEAREEIKERLCLRCRRSFKSAWAGERICPTCKTRSIWRSGGNWLRGAG